MLDYSAVDRWVKSNDKDSLLMARRLIAEEGMLVGMLATVEESERERESCMAPELMLMDRLLARS